MKVDDLINILQKYGKDSSGNSRTVVITDINNKVIVAEKDRLVKAWVSEGDTNEIRFFIDKFQETSIKK